MTFDPNKVYGDVPQSFSHRVEYALRHCEKEEAKPMKRKSIAAIIITVMMLALTTTAVAAALSHTIDFFGQEYGTDFQTMLEQGAVAPGGQSTQLNDAVFTLTDAVIVPEQITWIASVGEVDTPVDTLGFYATGVISVAEEENIVLLAQDEYTVNDPAGYALYYPAFPKAPEEGAPTYADIAREKGAVIRMVSCIPNGIVDEVNGGYYPCTPGVSIIPLEDGTVHFSAELTLECDNAPIQDSYQLSFWISTQDVDLEGNVIEGSQRSEDWIVTLTPEKAE